MQEGISHEACAYAGHLGLGKLIVPWQQQAAQASKTAEKVNSTEPELLQHFFEGLAATQAFYDDNGITIDGHTDLSFTEDVGKRFEGYGWQVLPKCTKTW